MAFDAAMLSFVLNEINIKLKNGRVEKVYQPSRDEITIIIRNNNKSHRLLINAGAQCTRIGITEIKTENPANAPMLCMLLRKHIQGSVFLGATQIGFERAARLAFDTTDELGYKKEEYIIVETMGTYSNIVFLDSNDKILGILKQIGFSESSKRQMLPGMIYEIPPLQDKKNPLEITPDDFDKIFENADKERLCEKFIIASFYGISPLVAREIAYISGGSSTATLADCSEKLNEVFFDYVSCVKNFKGNPYVIYKNDDRNLPVDFCFMPINQYGDTCQSKKYNSFGEMLDNFFYEKSKVERINQKASDILKIVSNSITRINKKILKQKKELDDCSLGEKYKNYADLLTANIYRLKRGQTEAILIDYLTNKETKISLDSKLTPAQNAQKYYKKYAKSKSAREHLVLQISLSEKELAYIESVKDSLSRIETEKELTEIRNELYNSGFAAKMNHIASKKQATPSFIKYKTSNGYDVFCGKNNTANDWLTFKHASRSDWWFHVKNMPGSHVILMCAGKDEPSEIDFTEAATIAAVNSSASNSLYAEVDYTNVKNIKKPPESKPGFVIYKTNWSANVKVDKKLVESLRV